MAKTETKRYRVEYLLGIVEEQVRDARRAAASGDMRAVRLELSDVREYITGVINVSKIIDAENAAKGKP